MKNIKYLFILVFFLIANNLVIAQNETTAIDKPTNQSTETPTVPLTPPTAEEEEKKFKVNISTTLISRFIWRGLELGDHPHIQPELTFSIDNFFFGAWASHGIGPVAYDQNILGYKEVIPYIGYTFEFNESTNFNLLLMDHYNPNFGDIGNWKKKGEGSNTLEIRGILKAGNFDLLGSVNVYNDDDNSNYVEVGYTVAFPKDFKVRPLISFTPTKSPFNGTSEFAFTQVGVIAAKDIKFSNGITLPIKVDFIVNPDMDKFYTAFGLGIKF